MRDIVFMGVLRIVIKYIYIYLFFSFVVIIAVDGVGF